ncbi:hypothetical protein [Pseudomonas pseudonitroreducens]|uniref:hypothetical protein n=1 Tax=Pseudomonas pseudonitroreducens TaxID=2892326 RepID=UPI001F33DEFF|nr:hypothetical protein [Pseudomonas pseudonitroreducens]
MESTVRDRRIAAVVPIAALLAINLSGWMVLLLVLAYFLLRRWGLPLAREVTLRVLDLFLSLALLVAAASLLIGALGVVARDGEMAWLDLLCRALVVLFIVLVGAYAMLSLGFSAFRAWCGQLHDAKLSMGILAALRGRPRATTR